VGRAKAAAFVAFGILAAPLSARAGTFGGFSPDGGSYLDDEARVCRLMDVAPDGTARGKPTCRPVRGAAERSTFRKPDAAGAPTIQARAKNRSLVLTRSKATLVTWTSPSELDRVEAVYEGKVGVVVEYRSGGAPAAVGFRLGASPSGATPGSNAGARAAPTKLDGSVWEQRIIPCEQAGVKLELLKTRKFRVTLETRCQSDRDRLRLSGTWAEEAGALVLTFPQDEGPEEKLACPITQCDGEPCIRCVDEDVSFTVLPARRDASNQPATPRSR
jgi:hypothetical protein